MSPDATIRRFGEKLRLLRQQRGLTLKELAQSLGYTTHAYISEIETGKKVPTAAFVLSVARLFNVTTDQLLRDEMEISGSESTME